MSHDPHRNPGSDDEWDNYVPDHHADCDGECDTWHFDDGCGECICGDVPCAIFDAQLLPEVPAVPAPSAAPKVSWAAKALLHVAGGVLMVWWTVMAASGQLSFGPPTAVLAGLVLAVVAIVATPLVGPRWWLQLAGWLLFMVAGDLLIPEAFFDSMLDTTITVLVALTAVVLAGQAAIWSAAAVLVWRDLRQAKRLEATVGVELPGGEAATDAIAADIEAGLVDVEKYLTRSADHLAPHTLAKMNGQEPRRVIGLWGYAGAGKDTAAAGLMVDEGYTRVSFADKLREFALAQDPLILVKGDEPHGTQLYAAEVIDPAYPERLGWQLVRLSTLVATLGWTEAKRIPEVRRFLQATGTDAGREVLGENVWVDAVMGDLPEGDVVFTDARFPNEAAAIRSAGGYMIEVERPGCGPVNGHVSETALADWDFDAVVTNDATPAEARAQLRETVEVLYDEDQAATPGL